MVCFLSFLANYLTNRNLNIYYRNFSDDKIDDIIKIHDIEKDGQISFSEFKQMLMGENESENYSSNSDNSD